MKYIENFFLTEKIQIPSNIRVKQIGNLLHFEGPLGFIELDFCKIDSLGLGFFRIINEKKDLVHVHQIEIFVKKDFKDSKAVFGSFLSLIKNTFHGVSQGFLVYLELIGVGFRANISEKTIVRDKTFHKSLPARLNFAEQNLEPNFINMEKNSRSSEPSPSLRPDQFRCWPNSENSKVTQIEFKIGQSHERVYYMPENIHVFSLKPTLLCFYGLDKIEITRIAAEIRDFMRPEPYKGKGIRYKDEEIQIKIGKKK